MPELSVDSAIVAALRAVVADHGAEMVAEFYEVLLQDQEAQKFLSHSVVHSRLSASLLQWLTTLFGAEDIRSTPDIQQQQEAIGRVHARIKIPVHLVMLGAMTMKSRITRILAQRSGDLVQAMAAVQLANERIDTAITLMSKAYLSDTTARARLDEAYRLFSIDQDVATEKEAQKASLMEWSQKTLFSLLRGQTQGGLDRLSDSAFGMWIRHRAGFMFEKSPAFQDLIAETQKIDRLLLPQIEEALPSDRPVRILADLQTAVDRVALLLNELFQTLTAMENGRDPLTRALNRRFLPAILGREIAFANENGTALCVILLDVDHFKSINDRYGHQTGDVILRQVAQVIMEHVRPSDFMFRYGGEEFLIVLPETSVAHAEAIADRIRAVLETANMDASPSEALSITASFGVAEHNGHPDQEYLIKAADDALYTAKARGRNRTEVALPVA